VLLKDNGFLDRCPTAGTTPRDLLVSYRELSEFCVRRKLLVPMCVRTHPLQNYVSGTFCKGSLRTVQNKANIEWLRFGDPICTVRNTIRRF